MGGGIMTWERILQLEREFEEDSLLSEEVREFIDEVKDRYRFIEEAKNHIDTINDFYKKEQKRNQRIIEQMRGLGQSIIKETE